MDAKYRIGTRCTSGCCPRGRKAQDAHLIAALARGRRGVGGAEVTWPPPLESISLNFSAASVASKARPTNFKPAVNSLTSMRRSSPLQMPASLAMATMARCTEIQYEQRRAGRHHARYCTTGDFIKRRLVDGQAGRALFIASSVFALTCPFGQKPPRPCSCTGHCGERQGTRASPARRRHPPANMCVHNCVQAKL